MHEKSRLPHSGRTFEVGVEVRTRDLSQRPCGYGNDKSRTSIEIDKRSRKSIEVGPRVGRVKASSWTVASLSARDAWKQSSTCKTEILSNLEL